MWGIILGPIICGFLFVTTSRYTRFKYEYRDRQVVLLTSTAIGLLSIALTPRDQRFFVWAAGGRPLFGRINSELTILEAAFASTVLLLLAVMTKARTSYEAGEIDPNLKAAIESVGDELDNLLLEAYLTKSNLLITLDNGKVYVVQVASTPTPRQTKYVVFAPILSGFRDEQQRVHLTTPYEEVIASNGEVKFKLVVELADITSFQTWDATAYRDFTTG